MSARSVGAIEYVYDPIRGRVRGTRGSPDVALLASRHAVHIDPDDAEATRLLCSLTVETGRDDAADVVAGALRQRPQDAELWFLRSRLETVSAARAGGFGPGGFESHLAATRRVVELDPSHRHARYHGVRVALRNADFAGASSFLSPPSAWSSWLDAPPGDQLPTLDEIVAELDGWRARTQPDRHEELVLVAYWWLVSRGEFVSAATIKRTLAEATLREQMQRPQSPSSLLRRLQALVTLERIDEAYELLRRSPNDLLARVDGHLREGLQADLAFGQGRLAVSHRQPVSADSEQDQTFRSLVDGKRVAVVGPTSRADGETEHHADVQLVTRIPGDRPSIPTIVYLANTVAAARAADITTALERRHVDLVALRPTALQSLPDPLRNHPGVRVVQREYALHLEATPYAVPRAVYDVTRFAPRSVIVANTDFFASGRQYDDRGICGLRRLERLPGYGHDHASDHRLMRALSQSGVISADRWGEEILDLTTTAYLHRLQERRDAGLG